jgi:hypothetical protein
MKILKPVVRHLEKNWLSGHLTNLEQNISKYKSHHKQGKKKSFFFQKWNHETTYKWATQSTRGSTLDDFSI